MPPEEMPPEEMPPEEIQPEETRVLPMFPLGTVLLPHAMLPLHVFEPRYRLMTRRVLKDDGEFGVVLIERGSEVGGGDTRFAIGTVARIVRAQELPDGGYALATVGIRRIRVVQWLADDPYPQASVVDLPDPPRVDLARVDLARVDLARVDLARVDPDADAGARARALAALDAVCALYRRNDPRIPELPAIGDAPEQASYEIAALAPMGPLDTQRVLEVERAGDRLTLLAELLDEHARVLRAGDALE